MAQRNPVLPNDWEERTIMQKQRYLEANADKIKSDQVVRRPLDDDEKESMRYNLQEESIKLSDKEAQYKEVQKQWREDINESKEAVSNILESLKRGYEEVTGTTYDIRDHDEGRVYVFMADGTIIDNRRMLPDEKQQTIQSNMRKIENDG